jgi:hypothetical protein
MVERRFPETTPFEQLKNQFAKIGRQIRAIQRQGQEPPQELVEKHISLDIELSQNFPNNWNSHYLNEETEI